MPNTNAVTNDVGQYSGTTVRPELCEIFGDVFQFEDQLSLQTKQQDIEKWDSLRHVALVAALENTFAISLSMDEMMEILSVADIQRVLARHGV